MLSGGNQRRALLRHQSEEMKNEWGSNPQPVDFTVTLCAPAPRLTFICRYKKEKYNITFTFNSVLCTFTHYGHGGPYHKSTETLIDFIDENKDTTVSVTVTDLVGRYITRTLDCNI